MHKKGLKHYIVGSLRIAVGLVFIFSGFVKAVDPWGTAIKLGEYYNAFGLDWLSGSEMFLSVAMSAAETLLGFAMLFNIGRRVIYTLMLLVMTFFTGLTFVLALTDPVSDCGCFGDAVKLTNWQTFYKNVVLWVFVLVIWIFNRRKVPYRGNRLVDSSLILLFALFSVGTSLYALRYLPSIDFLPFRVGTHIPSAMSTGEDADITTILIYKDKSTGEEQEFSLSDTVWSDTTRWEFVDTRFVEHTEARDAGITDFAVFNGNTDYTSELLSNSGATFIVTMTTLESIDRKCAKRLSGALDYAVSQGIDIIGVTTAPLFTGRSFPVGGHMVPMYNIDATTLKSLIRAEAGIVVLKEGTILAKWSCRGIPDLSGETDSGNVLAVLTSMSDRVRLEWLIGVLAGVFLLIYVVYSASRRR